MFIFKYICTERFNYYIGRIMIVTILRKFPFLLYRLPCTCATKYVLYYHNKLDYN